MRTTQVDFERVKRIKEIMKAHGLTQEGLGKAIGSNGVFVDQRSISRMFCSGKVSDTTCTLIAEAFPEYSLQWILYGEGDKTKEIFARNLLSGINDLIEKKDTTYNLLLELNGIHVSGSFVDGGYILKHDKKTVTMTVAEYNKFFKRIMDFVLFEWEHLEDDQERQDNIEKQRIVNEMFN